MDIQAQIDQDLKAALLAKDQQKATVLRSLKSAFQYAKTAPGNNGAELTNEALLAVMAKEAKKRQESADAYERAGAADRVKDELAEKAIIEAYLPAQLSDEELSEAIDKVIENFQTGSNLKPGMQNMGAIIGLVKTVVGTQADGGRIAQMVKEKLSA